MSALDDVRNAIANATGYHGTGDLRCPAHDDQSPSLSVNEGRDGRVVVYCHVGCDTRSVLDAVGLTEADLFEPDSWKTTRHSNGSGHRRVVDTYDYTDASGELIYQVVRYEPKDFRQRRPDGKGGWIWNMAGVDRVLYRWPEVVSAVGRGETIYVTEGEKDADAMRRELNAMATTNPGGAGKWSWAYADALEGADVVVIADADTAGIEHAKTVAATLAEGTPIFLPAEGHKDIAQHLGAGLTLKDLRPLTDDYDPEVAERQATAATFTDLIVGGDRILELPEPEPMVGTWLDRGMLAQLVGAYGSGKTFVALELALSVTTGRQWFGQQIHHTGQVLYIAGEGGYTFPDRIRGWVEDTGRAIPDELKLYPHRFDITDNGMVTGGLYTPLKAALDTGALDPALVVLDTRSRLTVGDENASETAQKLIAACDQIRDLVPNVTIMVIHHPGHGVTGRGRGHSSFEDNLDVVWSIEGRLRDGPVKLIDQKQKARAQNEDGMWLKLDTTPDGHPRMVVTAEPTDDNDDYNVRARIKATVIQHPGKFTAKDLYETGSIWRCGPQKKVVSTLRSMVNLGELVERNCQPPGGGRTANRYFLPEI